MLATYWPLQKGGKWRSGEELQEEQRLSSGPEALWHQLWAGVSTGQCQQYSAPRASPFLPPSSSRFRVHSSFLHLGGVTPSPGSRAPTRPAPPKPSPHPVRDLWPPRHSPYPPTLGPEVRQRGACWGGQGGKPEGRRAAGRRRQCGGVRAGVRKMGGRLWGKGMHGLP